MPWPGFDKAIDLNPTLTQAELAALSAMSRTFATRHACGLSKVRAELKRVLAPADIVLQWIGTPIATRYTAKHLLIIEMSRIGRPYWTWTCEECLEVLGPTVSAYEARHREYGNCRQHILALMCLLCGFDRLTEIGAFHRYHLAIKVFGRLAVDDATNVIYDEIARVGHKGHERYGIAQVLHTAFLIQRSARLDDISLGTLEKIAAVGPRLLRMASASLSRILVRLGLVPTWCTDAGDRSRICGRC